MTAVDELLQTYLRPWRVVNEGQRASTVGAIAQDPFSDWYVVDATGTVIVQIGDDENAEALGEGLVALAAAATPERLPLTILGATGESHPFVYANLAGRLLTVHDDGTVLAYHFPMTQPHGYHNIGSWLSVNEGAIEPAGGRVASRAVRAILDAGFDAIDPINAAFEVAVNSDEMGMTRWVSMFVALLRSVAELLDDDNDRATVPTALVVDLPQALIDMADLSFTTTNVRLIGHPDQAADGERIVHFDVNAVAS
mgnify:CR=1 FL=1